MALDVVPLNPGTGGANVSVDKINGVSVQVVKVAHGAEGTSTLVDATHGLPVADTATEAALGAPADAAATSDAGTFSLIALVKRLLGRFAARAGSSTAATAVVTAADARPANTDRRSLMVVNPRTNTATVWVNCWGTATTAPPSLPVEPGQRLVADGTSVPSGAVSIIAASGSQPVTIVEG